MIDRIKIREGTQEDFDDAEQLILSFVEEFLCYYGFRFSFNKAQIMMSACVENSLVLEMNNKLVGVIAGMPMPNMVDDTMIMSETVWYVLPEYRKYGLRLYFAFEKMVRSKGYNKLLMIHIGNSGAQILERFYIKHGFKLLEQHFIKEL